MGPICKDYMLGTGLEQTSQYHYSKDYVRGGISGARYRTWHVVRAQYLLVLLAAGAPLSVPNPTIPGK